MNKSFVYEIGGVVNIFAVTNLFAFGISLIVMIIKDHKYLSLFYNFWITNKELRENTIYSGLMFYLYNELSTLTLKQISGVSQSIANTFKRVLQNNEKKTGCTVHYVNEKLDGGNIIIQKSYFINPQDDEISLKKKTQKLEYLAYPEALIKIYRYS